MLPMGLFICHESSDGFEVLPCLSAILCQAGDFNSWNELSSDELSPGTLSIRLLQVAHL